MPASLLPEPLYHRHGIPFYHDKSEAEFRRDPYERYESMVLRQSFLHYGEIPGQPYPFQAILDQLAGIKFFPEQHQPVIAEIGCGLARIIGHLAANHPQSQCYGIDYSYQMLRWAQQHWREGKTLELDWSERGFPKQQISGLQLDNLHLALARAEALPFPDESVKLLFSSFLFDRVDDPAAALSEMHRVLQPGGTLFLFTPLNFQRADLWQQWGQEGQIALHLDQLGLRPNWTSTTKLAIQEPLDASGNYLNWNCRYFRATKIF